MAVLHEVEADGLKRIPYGYLQLRLGNALFDPDNLLNLAHTCTYLKSVIYSSIHFWDDCVLGRLFSATQAMAAL